MRQNIDVHLSDTPRPTSSKNSDGSGGVHSRGTYKSKYYNCKTAGTGSCFYCDRKTNFILDTKKEEIFCCSACALKNTKNLKLLRKIKRAKKDESRKVLHKKKRQNAKENGR